MKLKSMIPALCATFAIAGVSAADAKPKKHKRGQQHHSQQMQGNQAGSVGAGYAIAGPGGARTSGVVASGTSTRQRCGMAANTATTFGAGASYADRRSASGAASTGGTASGSGTVAASSGTDTYAVRDQMGSDAGASAGSDASAQEATRRPRGC